MNVDINPGVQDYLSCLLLQRHRCGCTIRWTYKSPYDQTKTIIVRDKFGQGAIKIIYDVPVSIITDTRLTPEEKALKIYSKLKRFLNG